ncbi:DUF4913 domain-containing protein [Streptomyces jumonjinensis]|uniref:DUF4913 domain-containing protein n=1 Tax=Streptomyces jumonjinensis TaxID=1945 RepID=A0A646KPK1_STRJU|nr:DUF4913 domain-containing protein [Streptomyces jumonjinensis]MQT02916.1 DUF4913 domain-containing protein [Streptomyces jumonjinensis]
MDSTPTVDGLAEDLEDLKAVVHGFASQLEHNTREVERLAAAVVPDDGQGDGGDTAGKGNGKGAGKGKGKEEPKTPPFILRLSGEQYPAELAALASWVRDLLVPTYLSEVSSSSTWCASWWEHPAAVARLHAAWLAWQELTNPEVCGLTGPSVWHRDHLDPMVAHLRAPDGPFAGCMTNPDRPQHVVLPVPPVNALPGPT